MKARSVTFQVLTALLTLPVLSGHVRGIGSTSATSWLAGLGPQHPELRPGGEAQKASSLTRRPIAGVLFAMAYLKMCALASATGMIRVCDSDLEGHPRLQDADSGPGHQKGGRANRPREFGVLGLRDERDCGYQLPTPMPQMLGL